MDSSGLASALWAHLWWVPPLLLLAAALKSLLPRLRGQAGEAAIARALARHFPTVANDVILPDGRGGLTQIDHLALTHRGILVVETKTLSGIVLGRPGEPTWKQIVGPRRLTINNPIRQNYGHQKAVESLEPRVPVHPLVVFAGSARFPKGIPAGTCNKAGLSRALEPFMGGEPPNVYRAAWDRLMTVARSDREARAQHLEGLETRYGGTRTGERATVVVVVVAIAWLVIGWLWSDPLTHRQGPPAATRPVAPAPAPTFPARPAPPPPRPAAIERPAVSATRVPPEPPRPATKVPNPPAPAPTQPAGKVATIEWADPNAKDDACTLATTAYLIERSAEARLNRTRACADRATDP